MKLSRLGVFLLLAAPVRPEDCGTMLPALERRAAEQPRSADANLQLGVNLFRCGESSRALVPLRTAAQLEPTNSSTYFYLGVSLLALDREEEAKNAFARMAALSPGDPDQLFLLQKGYSRLSAALSARIARVAPDSPRLNQMRAELLDLEHQPDPAIAEYKLAIQKQPRKPAFHYALGSLYWGRFQAAEALSEFQKTIELDPEHYMAHFKAGMALIELNQVDKAIEQLKDALALQPGLANAHLGLAKAQSQAGLLNEALNEADSCLKLDPANRTAQYLRAQILRKLGRTGEAQEQLKSLPIQQ